MYPKTAILLIAIAVTVVAAAVPEDLSLSCGRFTQNKFFQSNKTEFDDFPWLVLLEYNTPSGKQIICGGALVSSRYVLTSARCVLKNSHWSLASVRIGEFDTSGTPDCINANGKFDHNKSPDSDCNPDARSIKIDRFIIHENFSWRKYGQDIALLRLAEEIEFDGYVWPICLADGPSKPQQLYQVAGWSNIYGREGTSLKYRSNVTPFDRKQCERKLGSAGYRISEDQICLGGGRGEQACVADYGAPLMGYQLAKDRSQRFAVFGVFTTQPGVCDVPGAPGTFTDITPYRSWILKHLRSG